MQRRAAAISIPRREFPPRFLQLAAQRIDFVVRGLRESSPMGIRAEETTAYPARRRARTRYKHCTARTSLLFLKGSRDSRKIGVAAEGFTRLARLARRRDVLVCAGGDGETRLMLPVAPRSFAIVPRLSLSLALSLSRAICATGCMHACYRSFLFCGG